MAQSPRYGFIYWPFQILTCHLVSASHLFWPYGILKRRPGLQNAKSWMNIFKILHPRRISSRPCWRWFHGRTEIVLFLKQHVRMTPKNASQNHKWMIWNRKATHSWMSNHGSRKVLSRVGWTSNLLLFGWDLPLWLREGDIFNSGVGKQKLIYFHIWRCQCSDGWFDFFSRWGLWTLGFYMILPHSISTKQLPRKWNTFLCKKYFLAFFFLLLLGKGISESIQ